MKVELQPLQINELKKLKGNLLVVYVGNEKFIPDTDVIKDVYTKFKKVVPKEMKLIVCPYWMKCEVL